MVGVKMRPPLISQNDYDSEVIAIRKEGNAGVGARWPVVSGCEVNCYTKNIWPLATEHLHAGFT